MRIAAVVPLFNGALFIERAVLSALRQRRPPDEIIVVDDGSTDGGGKLVAQRFPNVSVLTQENRGEGAARNAGIALSTCDWVALLDADDVWLPRRLERHVESLDRDAALAAVYLRDADVRIGWTERTVPAGAP
jgi:glycosyltransferase involved in cell wall biosynthesis